MHPARKAKCWLLCAVLSLAADAEAPAQYSHYTPIGVRSNGMGAAGTADDHDVANVAFNPAVISMLQGLQATGQYNVDRIADSDQTYYAGVAGYGRRWAVGSSMTIGGGVGLGYVKLRMEWGQNIYLPAGPGDYNDRTFLISGGVVAGYREAVRVGVACNTKSRKAWNETDAGDSQAGPRWALYDLGVFATGDIVLRGGIILSAAAGFAYLNIVNREEELEDASLRYPEEYRRYGLHVRLATAPRPWMDDFFKTPIPGIAVTIDFDVEDPVSKRWYGDNENILRSGIELAVVQVMFLRAGYVHDRSYPHWIQEPTWGGGLGFPYGRFAARLDFSHSPNSVRTYHSSTRVDRVGLTVCARL